MNSKNMNIRDLYRGINDFKWSYQRSSNLVNDENGDLIADSHILSRWRNYFSQLLNVHRVSDVRLTEIHTAEPLIPDPNPFEVESAIAKLKRYKSPGTVGLPGRVTSPSQGRYLNTGQYKHKPNVLALSGIRTRETSVRESEDIRIFIR
ncbi:hypothetical protein B7P43_G06024 [Cryptotermes secundus]|uniref:Uncharacterized protein n=1 Tax=Cryptotermes secundus TaxID=105785 RepID=A0A2J7PDC1_9NEOP|nr:hypothetical protein B7P43_G06024 [Cryptotermes secundus]